MIHFVKLPNGEYVPIEDDVLEKLEGISEVEGIDPGEFIMLHIISTLDENSVVAYLPQSEEEYRQGRGEAVCVLLDEDTKKAYDKGGEGLQIKGFLYDESKLYPKLKDDVVVPCELRGNKTLVVPYSWLAENYGLPNIPSSENDDEE